MGDSASFGDSSRISRSERHNQEQMNYGLTIIIINIIIDSEESTWPILVYHLRKQMESVKFVIMHTAPH